MRELVQKLLPAELGHAPQHADDEPLVVPLQLPHQADLAQRLPLRLVAHAACVEEQKPSLALVDGHLMPAGDEGRRRGLAVTLVHLASVSFYVK